MNPHCGINTGVLPIFGKLSYNFSKKFLLQFRIWTTTNWFVSSPVLFNLDKTIKKIVITQKFS